MEGSNGKKRRRAEEPQRQRKQKRVSLAEEPSSSAKIATVSSVLTAQLSPPIIATTPGLSVADSICFDSYTKPAKKKRQNGPAVQDLLLYSSAHRTLDYTGKEDRASTADPLLRHYIAVFDPTTGQLRAAEARKLVIRGTVRSHRAAAEAMALWSAKKTAMDLKNELGQTFGTKKAKKAIRELTENAISPRKPGRDGAATPAKLSAGERALIESMKETTANMPSIEELQATVDLAKPVPKGHYDAEQIEDVYLPEEILGTEVLGAIPVRDWQKYAKAGNELQLFSQFVARRVNRTAEREDGLQGLRILRCLYWLIRCWHVKRQGKERGTWRLPPRNKLGNDLEAAPDVVIDKLWRTFSDQGVVRKFHKDLLMTHCCVFACILDNFEVNLVDLAEDLKLEQNELGQYFKEIGARVQVSKSKERTQTVAYLSLPLVFPQVRRRRMMR